MATTKRNDAKNQIMDILNKQGYPSYAKLVNLFDIYLTDDEDVVGYMIPGKAKIVLNQGLNIDQVSTIVRHEILHEYLVHGPRGEEFDKTHPELTPDHQAANIAGDYEISNRGYTDADKTIARAIRLGDKTLQGLVTEDQHPDWINLTFEEMYEKLLQEMKKNKESCKKEIQQSDKLNKKDADDLKDDIDQAQKQQQQDGNQESADKLGKMSDEMQKISDKLDKNNSGSSTKETEDKKNSEDQGNDANGGSQSQGNEGDEKQGNTPFDTPEEQKEKEDLAKRVAQIKKAFEDEKRKADIDAENVTAKRNERASKEARKIDRIQKSGISKFRLALNKFISNQVEEEDEDSYARENPAYADEGEFILPGRIRRENKYIPIINVYWDVSGSFQDPAKTAGARNAIATLNQYVRNGDIEIHTYYFADRVSDTESGAGGGTRGEPVCQHIQQTKPDNVIIITDGDTSNQRLTEVTVPGAVWMLFYDSRSEAMMKRIRGKKENKYFDIAY